MEYNFLYSGFNYPKFVLALLPPLAFLCTVGMWSGHSRVCPTSSPGKTSGADPLMLSPAFSFITCLFLPSTSLCMTGNIPLTLPEASPSLSLSLHYLYHWQWFDTFCSDFQVKVIIPATATKLCQCCPQNPFPLNLLFLQQPACVPWLIGSSHLRPSSIS